MLQILWELADMHLRWKYADNVFTIKQTKHFYKKGKLIFYDGHSIVFLKIAFLKKNPL